MLYRTHHNPFLLTSLSPHLLPSPSIQGMECLQGALKRGFSPETTAFLDDNGGIDEDDLFVDELLDFSNGFSESDEPEENELEEKNSCSVSEKKLTVAYENYLLSENDDFVSLPQTVPVEGLESLEWLSNFMEDSFSDYSLTGKLPPKPAANRPGPPITVHEPPCFTTPVQTKSRTKRARTGVHVWPVLSDSSATSSVSSTSSTTSFSPPNYEYFLGKPLTKEKKKKVVATPGGRRGSMPAQPRGCSHCGVTKTPQWRAGPFGSKTLCNACGVRYKSGRLLPEYRPACSPTYSSELHSNNHRKVLEMRRKRETKIDAAGFLTVKL